MKRLILFLASFSLCCTMVSAKQMLLRFTVLANGLSDETVIRIHEEATPMFDGNLDAYNIPSLKSEYVDIYSTDLSGTSYSINSQPLKACGDGVSLTVKLAKLQVFTLQVSDLNSLQNVGCVTLVNRESGEVIPISGSDEFIMDPISLETTFLLFIEERESPTLIFPTCLAQGEYHELAYSSASPIERWELNCGTQNYQSVDGKFLINGPGHYVLTYQGSDNCAVPIKYDTVYQVQSTPNLNLTVASLPCQPAVVTLDTAGSNLSSLVWADGSNALIRPLTQGNQSSIKLTGIEGCQNEVLVDLKGNDELPVADLYIPHLDVFIGQPLFFINYSSGATTVSWRWEDQLSTVLQPQVCFMTPGEQLLTLIVSNGDCSDTLQHSIQVLVQDIVGIENPTSHGTPSERLAFNLLGQVHGISLLTSSRSVTDYQRHKALGVKDSFQMVTH